MKEAEEKSASDALKSLLVFVNKKQGVINSIQRVYEYSDDPKFYSFGAILFPCSKDKYEDELSNSTSGFSYYSEELALLKCIGESLERDAVRRFSTKNFVTGSFSDLQKKSINPNQFIAYSNKQFDQKHFAHVSVDQKTPFSWVKGRDELRNEYIFMPAQLIYLSYKPLKGERYIYLPTTSGLAGGGTQTSALVRSIFENIERDSFLIHYLTRSPGKKINLESIQNNSIQELIHYVQSYYLEIVCIELQNELGVSTFLTIIINQTGIGPALSLGLKTDLDKEEAIAGSIQEALHTRGWIRSIVEKDPTRLSKVDSKKIEQLDDRAMLWYTKDKIELLSFFIDQKEADLEINNRIDSFSSKLEYLKKQLSKNKMDLYWIDVTPQYLDGFSFRVVKSIIPQLQPFYLNEEFPCWGGKRLMVKLGKTKINTYPHPFL